MKTVVTIFYTFYKAMSRSEHMKMIGKSIATKSDPFGITDEKGYQVFDGITGVSWISEEGYNKIVKDKVLEEDVDNQFYDIIKNKPIVLQK